MKRIIVFILLIIYSLYFGFMSLSMAIDYKSIMSFNTLNIQMILFLFFSVLICVFGIITVFTYLKMFRTEKKNNPVNYQNEIDYVAFYSKNEFYLSRKQVVFYAIFTSSLFALLLNLLISLTVFLFSNSSKLTNWFMIYVMAFVLLSTIIFFIDLKSLNKKRLQNKKNAKVE